MHDEHMLVANDEAPSNLKLATRVLLPGKLVGKSCDHSIGVCDPTVRIVIIALNRYAGLL